MSNIHQLDQHVKNKHAAATVQEQAEEKCLDEASEWIAKLDRNLSLDEKTALQSWLISHPRNTEVLLEVAQLWDKMDELSRLSDLFPQHPAKKRKLSTWLNTMAASLFIALTIGLYQSEINLPFFGQENLSAVVVQQMNYQTGIGEINTINLPDNSKLVLNTNSFVQIKYTEKARIIELQRGEIHIDVAHDTARPLSVITGGKVIQAVGTAFNVEIRNELVELIVTDGKVLVAQKQDSKQRTLLNEQITDIEEMAKRLPRNSMAISKGEKVDLDLSGKAIEKVIKVDSIDVAASLSWRQGNLIFRGESLADTMKEISRYTDIEFELADDEELNNVHVAGMFKTGDVKGLLEVLSNNFNITYERVNSNKFILSYAG